MKFKDDIASDNLEVFLNVEEFAEYVDINSTILKAQVQYRTEEKSSRQNEIFEGLHGDFVKIFFRTADYIGKNQNLPNQGSYVHINKKLYRVLTCKDEMGITQLCVSAYRQEQPFKRLE